MFDPHKIGIYETQTKWHEMKYAYIWAYLNGKLFENIFAYFSLIFRLFFIYFTKKMALTVQLAWEKAEYFSKYFLFQLVVIITLKDTIFELIRKVYFICLVVHLTQD